MAEAAVELDEKRKEEGRESRGKAAAREKAPAGETDPGASGGAKKARKKRRARWSLAKAEPNPDLVVKRIDDGGAYLRRLVVERLKTEGPDFADKLFKRAKIGESNAVWAIIKILQAEKPPAKQPKQRKRRGRSLAEIWAAEPQWEAAQEETAEAGSGGREPEM